VALAPGGTRLRSSADAAAAVSSSDMLHAAAGNRSNIRLTAPSPLVAADVLVTFDYGGSSMPTLPTYNDTATTTTFTTSLRKGKAELPSRMDEDLFFTVGLGLFNCSSGQNCDGPNNTRFTASINNVSFVPPSTFSIL
jgi:hypothetical protein